MPFQAWQVYKEVVRKFTIKKRMWTIESQEDNYIEGF